MVVWILQIYVDRLLGIIKKQFSLFFSGGQWDATVGCYRNPISVAILAISIKYKKEKFVIYAIMAVRVIAIEVIVVVVVLVTTIVIWLFKFF